MGLFDKIIGAFTGSAEGATASGPLAIMEMVTAHAGGLDGLVQKFQAAGMGAAVQSWVGTGENLPISADTVHQVLGSDMMKQIAEKTGLPLDQVSSLKVPLIPESGRSEQKNPASSVEFTKRLNAAGLTLEY
jgi:uncharacterized protein YidB (DUF937 family)